MDSSLYYYLYFPPSSPFLNLHNFKLNRMLNSSARYGNKYNFIFLFLCPKVPAPTWKFWQTHFCSSWPTANLFLASVWPTSTGSIPESHPVVFLVLQTSHFKCWYIQSNLLILLSLVTIHSLQGKREFTFRNKTQWLGKGFNWQRSLW